MQVSILLAASVIIACILCNRISSRFGIPMLFVFILLGMFFGSDGVIRIRFDDFGFAEQICSIALIFIMFYGGFGTKWSAAKPVIKPAVLLSTAGVILTAGLTGLFCYGVLKMGWMESFLIGALVSSTDAASVFSVLRSRRLNLKYHTASLLEVESGSNDPCAYMLTTILLGIMAGQSTSAGSIVYSVFAQIIYGALLGMAAAAVTGFVIARVKFTTEGFDTVFVFAMVLLAYAAPSVLGGNGYLSVYIFGIMLGNKNLSNKRSLVNFFDGVTGLMQMLLFFLLGLLSFPSVLPQVMLPGLFIALFLTFVARPLAVALILTPFGCPIRQQLFVSVAGLRGAASIVFAIMAVTSDAPLQEDMFHIVFFIVLFSILLQGSLLPKVAGWLAMTDDKEDVLKTFTDYTEEVPVQFIQFTVTKNHPWAGSKIRDILLPPETLLVQIGRGKDCILTPDGDTVLQDGDELILSARAPKEQESVQMSEITLEKGHAWIEKRVSDIRLGSGRLMVMIQRAGDIVIPNGNTRLMEQDVIVLKEG